MMDHKMFLIMGHKTFGITETVIAWTYKGLSSEKIRPSTTSSTCLSSKLKWRNSRIRVEFKGSYLKQDKVTLLQKM